MYGSGKTKRLTFHSVCTAGAAVALVVAFANILAPVELAVAVAVVVAVAVAVAVALVAVAFGLLD